MKNMFKKYREKWHTKSAVSEIIGTLMLLAIAVILFSSLIVYVLSMDDDPASPSLNLVGRVATSGENAIIEHNGGDTLRLKDTKVILQRGDIQTATVTFDSQGNAYDETGSPLGTVIKGGTNGDTDEWWEIGEYFSYNGFNANLKYWRVYAIVIDTVSNSVIMSGTINTGINDYVFTDNSQIAGNANFSYTPDIPLAGETVTFTDSSDYSNYIDSWEWDFGDGNTSIEQNPTLPYSEYGTYTVTLTITYQEEICGEAVTDFTDTKTDQVKVYTGPIANFTWNPDSPSAGEQIVFTDASTNPKPTGNINNWEWDFGDGNTSTPPNPTKTYDTADDYWVTLTVNAIIDGRTLSDSTTKKVPVIPGIQVDFPYVDLDNNSVYNGDDFDITQWLIDYGEYEAPPNASIVFPTTMDDFNMNEYSQHQGLTLKADVNITIDANISADQIILEATNIFLSKNKPITLWPEEHGGNDAVFSINAEGNIYANNTYILIEEDGGGGTGIEVDIDAQGDIYFSDSVFECHETGADRFTFDIVSEYGKLDITNLSITTEDTGSMVPGNYISFSAYDDILATGMTITSPRLETFDLYSESDIDISHATINEPNTILAIQSSNGAVIAQYANINAKSGTSPMLWGHTSLDFSSAEITNGGNSLLLVSDQGLIEAINATVTQNAASDVRIWFGESGTGDGDINLSLATIYATNGDIDIISGEGYMNYYNAIVSTTTSTNNYINIYSEETVDCREAQFLTKTQITIHVEEYLYLNDTEIKVTDGNINFECTDGTAVIYAHNTWLSDTKSPNPFGVEAQAINFINDASHIHKYNLQPTSPHQADIIGTV